LYTHHTNTDLTVPFVQVSSRWSGRHREVVSLRRPACLRASFGCRASGSAKYPTRARRIGTGQSLCVKTRMNVHRGVTAPLGSPGLPVPLENTAANHGNGVPIVNMLVTCPAHARQHGKLCWCLCVPLLTAHVQATHHAPSTGTTRDRSQFGFRAPLCVVIAFLARKRSVAALFE
jgi:hypothetical protein